MKVLSLLSALLLFSLSSLATQLSPKEAHRNNVLENLRRKQCASFYQGSPKPLAIIGQESAVPVVRTRGATRSARGIEPVARKPFHPEIAKQIQENNLRFQDLIRIEFGLPFGGGNNLSTYQFLVRDKIEAAHKLYWLEKLGFKWKGGDEPMESPDWVTLSNNFKKALKELEVEESDFFIPAMIFYRDTMVRDKDGQMVPSKEYQFVDPIKEDTNGLTAEWKVLTSDVQFNLPFSAMMEGMKKGMFPMLDSVHDVFHMVAFLRFVEGTKTELSSIRRTPEMDYSYGFKRREYWLTEALSVMLPDSREVNLAFLKSNKRGMEEKSVEAISEELSKMKVPDLIDYALKVSNHFGDQLRDVSGGNSSPAEKWYYLGEVVGVPGADLVENRIQKNQKLNSVMDLSNSYFNNGPVIFSGNSKRLTNQTATFSFSTFNLSHRLLAQGMQGGIRSHFPSGTTKAQLVSDLINYTARTEWLLRREIPSLETWFDHFLTRDMNPNGELGQIMRQMFNNEIVDRYYLGEGEKFPALQ